MYYKLFIKICLFNAKTLIFAENQTFYKDSVHDEKKRSDCQT